MASKAVRLRTGPILAAAHITNAVREGRAKLHSTGFHSTWASTNYSITSSKPATLGIASSR